ncbi:MAG: hypothetical protein QXX41_14260 [Nitrososphaerota archaeon]
MKWRITYGILWLLTVVMYSLPWAKVDDSVYIGWNFTMPFSVTYVIGMLLGLIVLIMRYKPVLMTIVAGILMILGLVGATIGFGVMAVIGGLVGAKVSWEAGAGGAFLFTIIYMVAGAYAGKKMVMKRV